MASGIHVDEVSSRSAQVMWSPPFSGNSRITRYIMSLSESSCRPVSLSSDTACDVTSRSFNVTISGQESSCRLTDLFPASNYSLTLTAVNVLGASDASHPLTFATDEEGEFAVNE